MALKSKCWQKSVKPNLGDTSGSSDIPTCRDAPITHHHTLTLDSLGNEICSFEGRDLQVVVQPRKQRTPSVAPCTQKYNAGIA